MACPCRIQVFHADAAHARQVCERMRDEVLRIEAKYSRYRDDSALSRINRSAGDERGVVVDDETAALLDYAAAAWRDARTCIHMEAVCLRCSRAVMSGGVSAH